MTRDTKVNRQVDRSKWVFTEEQTTAALEGFSFDVKSLTRIRDGDDWSRVVQAHLYFDHVVTKMLEEELRRPEKVDLDRVSFSARVDLCAALGLIGDQASGMLRAINRLRNSLAHDLTAQVTQADIDRLFDLASKEEKELIRDQRVLYPNDSLLYRILGTVLITLDIQRQAVAKHRLKRAEGLEKARALLESLRLK